MTLLGFPVPPTAAIAAFTCEVRRANRTVRPNLIEQAFDIVAMVCMPLSRVFPPHAGRVEHSMTQQPVVFYGQETRLVRPVFEQGAFSQMLGEPLRLIVAKAAEQHEVRAARDHVN